MRIMCDIDGVLAVNNCFNPLTNKLVVCWDTFIDHIPQDKPIEENIELIKSLAGHNNEMFYVSARIERAREFTTNWFKDNGIPFERSNLILRDQEEDEIHESYKLMRCRELEPDLVLEDDIDVARTLSEHGYNVMLFLRKGWNV